jgi:dihydroneopterin aldolase
MKGTIELNGLRFHSYHGCFDYERSEGGEYTVDFSATLDLQRAAQSDDLADTVDLEEVYYIIEREMMVPSSLIEHVATRIASSLKEEFPQLLSVTVRLTKLTPPLPGPADSSSVTITL